MCVPFKSVWVKNRLLVIFVEFLPIVVAISTSTLSLSFKQMPNLKIHTQTPKPKASNGSQKRTKGAINPCVLCVVCCVSVLGAGVCENNGSPISISVDLFGSE